jgi:hypothetical protein
MSLSMMQGHIAELRKDLAGTTGARDLILKDAGFESYDDFLRAAVPHQPARGIRAWLRGALRAFSSVGPWAAAPKSPSLRREIAPATMDAIQMKQLEIDAFARRLNSLEVEVEKKFSIPAACLVFVLVGAPLGMRARKSGIAVAFLSILFFVFYYLCLAGGEELADRRILAPWFAMWAPNIVIGAIGLVLTLQAAELLRRPRRRAPRTGRPRVIPA